MTLLLDIIAIAAVMFLCMMMPVFYQIIKSLIWGIVLWFSCGHEVTKDGRIVKAKKKSFNREKIYH